MLELKLIDQKCELDIRGKRHECIAEMAIAFEALIETAAEAAGNGMTYEKAKQMLCDGADKVREVKTRDGE
jgi:hypothetical protein